MARGTADALDSTLVALLESVIPFNRHIGVKVASVDRQRGRLTVTLALRDEHIGNVVRRMAHGGLVAALIDAASGGAAALTLDDLTQAPSVATIDMRVDFLRPGRGPELSATAEVMRSGRSVIVVRTEVHDTDGSLVAIGSSAFTVERAERA